CVALAVLTVALSAPAARADEVDIQMQNGGVIAEFDLHHRLAVNGDGEITHLGHTRMWGDGVWYGTGQGTFAVSFGSVIIRAANGDVVYATFEGNGVRDAYGNVGFADLSFTILGGTGRFENATGGFEVLFSYDPETGEYASSLEGTIDY